MRAAGVRWLQGLTAHPEVHLCQQLHPCQPVTKSFSQKEQAHPRRQQMSPPLLPPPAPPRPLDLPAPQQHLWMPQLCVSGR